MIRTLVFDLDDTLFSEREFVYSGFDAVDTWLRKEKAIAGFRERAKAEFDSGVRGKIFDRALLLLGVPQNGRLVERMVEVYRDHQPRIRLFQDAEWALEYFSSRCRLALLTDGYLTVQQRKVAALELSGRFATIVYSDRFGREGWKPSPRPYEQIITDLGCAPAECAYVGDNPAKDFVTAKRLGWFTIRVRRPRGEYFEARGDENHEADAEIESLQELDKVIERGGCEARAVTRSGMTTHQPQPSQ